MTTATTTGPFIETRPAGEVFRAGVLAGIIGGALMAAFSMMYTAAVGAGFWTPLRLIGATFYGVDALVGGSGVLLWGMIVHFMSAIVLGVVFAAIAPRRLTAGPALFGGVIWGLVALVVMTFVVMPIVDRTMLPRVAMMPGMWVAAHVAFGIGVASAPALRRRFAVSGHA